MNNLIRQLVGSDAIDVRGRDRYVVPIASIHPETQGGQPDGETSRQTLLVRTGGAGR
ncbi:hypothetical protein MA6G0728R_0689 [Mycobacteroides abscessus 6G-0728-R]|uniref:Uncharacterized protein n=1 Tax=Mycobacteroides abscessus 1948 TaxID=1299323 RepID=A0A829QP81_9MYCO|nr:hypothetical protein MA6G0125R_4959 [Mycobacteroides abscessus 6G-0125-R]EIU50460.1 hypothetical protein MA6G0125S_0697 [Mycobacteroides abscessus 6G-0125-S]EIU56009.1 hypothetical protein MA6G0728S_1027 [Mycobacteroides abscessus 6G-0728-S]EIU66892.1 hypothetical protein MA6G1108_0685 [Mycobacteroides abscessus 6G-1108]EIU99471.1 hypothetical protein MA6G0212_0756 [Mycobacteroides abscessus 6G-0212]EIV02693.1 hypothetical protein MA6G0728R_0689 [Mycobacteroides abscessus 6G-0728-R]EIV3926